MPPECKHYTIVRRPFLTSCWKRWTVWASSTGNWRSSVVCCESPYALCPSLHCVNSHPPLQKMLRLLDCPELDNWCNCLISDWTALVPYTLAIALVHVLNVLHMLKAESPSSVIALQLRCQLFVRVTGFHALCWCFWPVVSTWTTSYQSF